MPRLRRLTARQLLRALRDVGFEVATTRGSHAKLVRVSPSGERHVLTVPLHSQLAPGTLRAIFRQAARLVPESELRPKFFTE